jgi:uncharacterized protein YhbP (UPF0306 family)
MTMADTKTELLDYLATQAVMSLATFGEHPSICTVYFTVDKDLNFYFISRPETEHCKNIELSGKVACSIADGRQKVSDKKIGVQMEGTAVELPTIEKIGTALMFWSKANFAFEGVVSVDAIKDRMIASRAYKITPTEIKFFNEELFGPEGVEMIAL